jgi:hypothetical protein
MNSFKIIRPDPVQDPRSHSFERWLLSLGRKINKKAVSYGLTATLLTTTYGGLYKHLRELDAGLVLSITSGAQLLIVFFLIALTKVAFVNHHSPRPSGGQSNPRGKKVETFAAPERINPANLGADEDALRPVHHYRNYFLAMWLCWLALYLVFTIQYAPGVSNNPNLVAALKALTTLLNNCATLACLYCYLTLRRSDEPRSTGVKDGKQSDWPIWGATLIMLTGVEVLCVAQASVEVSIVFGWISGIGSATVLGLHTLRLADKSLHCPPWVVVLLLAYAGLQTGFVALDNNNPRATFVLLNFALLLKTLLYLYISWAFRYGWLMHYFSARKREKSHVPA